MYKDDVGIIVFCLILFSFFGFCVHSCNQTAQRNKDYGYETTIYFKDGDTLVSTYSGEPSLSGYDNDCLEVRYETVACGVKRFKTKKVLIKRSNDCI